MRRYASRGPCRGAVRSGRVGWDWARPKVSVCSLHRTGRTLATGACADRFDAAVRRHDSVCGWPRQGAAASIKGPGGAAGRRFRGCNLQFHRSWLGAEQWLGPCLASRVRLGVGRLGRRHGALAVGGPRTVIHDGRPAPHWPCCSRGRPVWSGRLRNGIGPAPRGRRDRKSIQPIEYISTEALRANDRGLLLSWRDE